MEREEKMKQKSEKEDKPTKSGYVVEVKTWPFRRIWDSTLQNRVEFETEFGIKKVLLTFVVQCFYF